MFSYCSCVTNVVGTGIYCYIMHQLFKKGNLATETKEKGKPIVPAVSASVVLVPGYYLRRKFFPEFRLSTLLAQSIMCIALNAG